MKAIRAEIFLPTGKEEAIVGKNDVVDIIALVGTGMDALRIVTGDNKYIEVYNTPFTIVTDATEDETTNEEELEL